MCSLVVAITPDERAWLYQPVTRPLYFLALRITCNKIRYLLDRLITKDFSSLAMCFFNFNLSSHKWAQQVTCDIQLSHQMGYLIKQGYTPYRQISYLRTESLLSTPGGSPENYRTLTKLCKEIQQ